MNKHLTEQEINLYLQRSLKLALRYGDQSKIGRKILAIASKAAYEDLRMLRDMIEMIREGRRPDQHYLIEDHLKHEDRPILVNDRMTGETYFI